MADSSEPLVQTCATCGALIDVTDEEPFALMHCPNCGTGMRVRRTFDHFELQEILGAGGMGAVYRALDANLNRMVALKLLRVEHSEDEAFIEQFQREAAITASINHPYVVKVYSSGEDHGMLYIAMELVDKGSLDDLMNLQGRVAEAQVLEVGIQIAEGLEAALQRGLIHRDIKPGNILFADAHTAKIVDFGLAVLMDQASTVAGEVWGTPYYVAPEKLDQQPEDHRSDIYSLGATLFHAVAGRPPFEAETASMVALKHVKSQAVSLKAFAPDVSTATAYVINKTLNKDPKERYQSYAELIEHLQYARRELLEKVGSAAAQKARVVLGGEAEQKAMSWITFGIIAVIVLTGLLAYTMRDRFGGKEQALDKAVEELRQQTAAIEPRYKDARQLLLAGSHAEAAEAFRALDTEPNTPQPMRSWIVMHEGLAELLAGRDAEARAAFEKIESRGLYSSDPGEQKVAKFFLETARMMIGRDSIPVTISQKYEKTTYEAFALLLFALKNWSLEKFEDAVPLFRQFNSSTPRPPVWFSDETEFGKYRELTAAYVEDWTEFRTATEAIKNANTPEERKKAVEVGKAARGKLRLKGKLVEQLDAAIAELEQSTAAHDAEEASKLAEQEAADTELLNAAKRKVADLCRKFKFAEAQQAAQAPRLSTAKMKAEQSRLVKKSQWLAQFKGLLTKDLNVTGYAKPIAKKVGAPPPGVVARADDTQIHVKTQFGEIPVAWTDLTYDSVYAMAGSFIRPEQPQAADRKWLLGVFAFFAGKSREGRELIVEAAQARPQYQADLPLFLEFEGE